MSSRVTMGNLFSGSGAWELAAKLCGIDVLFEAEIEPFPVALEAKRFPEAIQLGDVSKIDGHKIPLVDILTNSSPCQDLSIAGKRAGMDGERSGLFMEAVRIAKEMLDAYKQLQLRGTDEHIRPLRYFCWENVPGVFSSNGGDDFRTALEEMARIADPTAVIPEPPKQGWGYAGVVDGEGWQIAWRTMDAQFWGVPQRRRRVFVVLDIRGASAGAVLLEREGSSWHFAEIASTWQMSARSLEDRIDLASRIVRGEVLGTPEGVGGGVRE